MSKLVVAFTVIFIARFNICAASFFDIHYPDVFFTAEQGGNLSIKAGPNGGDIIMIPQGNGTVFIGQTDMLKLFELVNSLPPVWSEKSPHGTLGTFLGGKTVSLSVSAQDPEKGAVTYEKVSGALPPGVHLNKLTGAITGRIPDVDATYEFGIRVTDKHGKYADQIFSIDTRERDQCLSSPCLHGGTCSDDIEDFVCACVKPYGGKTCHLNCASSPVGIDQNRKRIPDAQMSCHYCYDDSAGVDGRLHAPQGWVGQNTNSWLQVDLGREMELHAVANQGHASSSYYILTYTIKYSLDGNTFYDVKNGTSVMDFSGSSSVNSVIKHTFLAPFRARFIKFIPKTFHGKPGMRVELYGCDV
ncbi:EGF-like repeat and discoidin I-like domain-containing protein 3 [Saccostrea echinata]|uniref:EGF-like repeat and discoidin I-like domain-containing protein 3 n=1 Tax=Saccostrea echinata TaxID=191078 RepID=UPI002A8369FC|nr:EGF-like repeat and discoidin I-like domain-containing protein 3 [Saccostrea echinata]